MSRTLRIGISLLIAVATATAWLPHSCGFEIAGARDLETRVQRATVRIKVTLKSDRQYGSGAIVAIDGDRAGRDVRTSL